MKITEMEKQMYYAIGHQVEVKLKDGNICNGFCSGYTSSIDNEPEPAEIDINKEGYSGLTCITEPEIDKITIIE